MSPAKKAAPKPKDPATGEAVPAPVHPDGTHESRSRPMAAPDPHAEAEAAAEAERRAVAAADKAAAEEAERAEAEGAAEAAAEAGREAPSDNEIDARLAISTVDGEFNPMVTNPTPEQMQPDEQAEAAVTAEDEALKAWAASRRAELDAEFEAEEAAQVEQIRRSSTDGVGLNVPTPNREGTAATVAPVTNTLRALSPCALVFYVVDGRDVGTLDNIGRNLMTPGDVCPAMVIRTDGPGRGTIRVFGPSPECDYGVTGVALIETPAEVGAEHMGRCFWPPRV